MVDFRRWILALAVLALFTGLASAQVGTNSMSCNSNLSTVNTLRGEGLTEQTGDIVLTCTGGTQLAPGTAIPRVNISVSLNTNVTSRLFPTTAAPNASEALLLIDEPGAPIAPIVAGFGPAAPQTLCTTLATGCTEIAETIGGTSVATDGAGNPGANVFQGIYNPDGTHFNLVTFFGVPILPPGTVNSRVFRITNIRANASLFSGGNFTPIIAQIAVSVPTALAITNSTPTVGVVQSGLSTSVKASGATVSTCAAITTPTAVASLSFSERFASAFKTRLDAGTTSNAAGGFNQNVPGAPLNSESNFVFPVPGGTAGLADFGTRLKATFHNVPTAVTLTVSTTNTDATPGSTAVLVATETVVDTAAAPTPLASGALTVAADGTATAVWEVVTTNPGLLDTLTFSVTTTFPSSTTPGATPVTVSLSFAPSTPGPAFPAATGTFASSTLPIPRFADLNANGGTSTVLAINICHTILLYPFVTNAPGFDTGIAIANTSSDPFGTVTQHGLCTLNWFSGATNPPIFTTPDIAAGTVFTTILSVNTSTAGIAGGFTGYMIASCNFQYAHGFAFISDLGTRNFAMGFLALVIPDPSNNGGLRQASDSGSAAAGSGENVSH